MENNICNIKVIGVGGGGNNAVERMINAGITSASFVAVNTDKQALLMSSAQELIQIGIDCTKGLGAGSDPTKGENAAIESKEEIKKVLEGCNLVFITAGMGGGTGTGAAPVVAQLAKEMGILTVAVVTKPFSFEGPKRMANAELGISNLKKYVDSIVIIPNDKLNHILKKGTSVVEAFRLADDVLRQGIQGVADVIVTPSLINLDFADVKTIMEGKGLAHMGIGRGKGENRTIEAVRQAVTSQLLETSIEGASGILLNIKGGEDLALDEVVDAVGLVRDVASPDVNLIYGTSIDKNMNNEVEITVIATGFEKNKPQPTVADAPSFADHGKEFVAFNQPTANPTAKPVNKLEPEVKVEDIKPQPQAEKPKEEINHIKVDNSDLPPFLRKLKGN